MREAFPDAAFGFGGLTAVDAGNPVPCLRLLEEMARLGCDFSFLRRSFKRDMTGRDPTREIRRLRSTWDRLRRRGAAEVEVDHGKLRDALELLYGVSAGSP